MLLVTSGAAAWTYQRPGLYYGQIRVLFLAPPSERTPNNLVAPSNSLITTAGVVAKMVGASFDAPPVVSDTVTLPGEGVRYGWSVHLPNTGGQWAANFAEPAVVVQAVAPTVEGVDALIAYVLARVRAALTELEDQALVDSVNRIVLVLNPDAPVVLYVHGSAKRAAATVLVLGLAATWAVYSLLRRRGAVGDPEGSDDSDAVESDVRAENATANTVGRRRAIELSRS